MKRITLIFAAALLAGSVSFAQPQKGPVGAPDPDRMALDRTEHMVKRYNLSAEQAAQMLELNKLHQPKMTGERHHKGIQPGHNVKPGERSSARPAQKPKLTKEEKAEMKAYQKGVKKILTKDQFKLYKKDVKERQDLVPGPGPDRIVH